MFYALVQLISMFYALVQLITRIISTFIFKKIFIIFKIY